MANKHLDKSGYGPVFESSSAIAGLLRSAANPSRIKILALAMRGSGESSSMAKATLLSKTALANHVSQLVDEGLMRRQARGKYELTPDGKELLSAAFSTYKRSMRRVDEEKERIKRSYVKAFGQPADTDRFEIASKVEYQPCWLSLLGAVAGSLTALGAKCNTVDVGGHTGYPFLINVSKGETCPSGPTALHIKTFLEMLEAVQSLGWRIQNFEYPHSYPSGSSGPTPDELRVVKGLFERIKKEMEENGRPVVVYGLASPEYGIVRGYEGESYIVSTFRSQLNPGVAEAPIPYHSLNAPGCVDALFFERKVRVRKGKARRAALARALKFAEGRAETQKNYLSGPSALEEWARVLEEVPRASQNYMGNSYVGACVQEGRELSSAFLKGISKKMASADARHLARASASYSKGARTLAEFTRIFPFRFEGAMPATKRKRGAALLREAESHEEKAIQHLRKVA